MLAVVTGGRVFTGEAVLEGKAILVKEGTIVDLIDNQPAEDLLAIYGK